MAFLSPTLDRPHWIRVASEGISEVCVILFCFSNYYITATLVAAIISMSNNIVIKSNDYTIAVQSFDNIFRFSHFIFSIQRRSRLDSSACLHFDLASCSGSVFRRSVRVSEERSCFGGAFTFRRSSVWEEDLCFGGVLVFRKSWKMVSKKLFVFRRNLDFDYSFGNHVFVLCLPISQ